jgi:CCR4-NOT transcription complex subunit 1
LTHRLLIPAFLSGNGRSNGGWFVFGKLVECLLTNLEELLALPDTPPVVQDFYRGSIRLFTLIHHDFPEFLSENHVVLNSQIPMQCIQLQNIVNSAASRMTIRDQPDPFLAGLKINRLDASRHAPVEQTDVRRILTDAGIDAAVDRILTSNVIEDTPFATILSVVDNPGRSELIINALVFHLGVHATQGSPAFSAGAAPGRLIDRLVRDTIPSTRVSLIHAMSNQVRFVSSHTQYFSTALQHLFSAGTQEIQELILRVLCERLVVARPHPWGLIVLMLEMVKNPSVDLWGLPWVQAAPQVENMLRGIAREQSLAREQNQEFGGRMGRLRAES